MSLSLINKFIDKSMFCYSVKVTNYSLKLLEKESLKSLKSQETLS